FEDDHGGDGMSADEAGERDDAEVFVENNDGNGGDDQPSRRRRSITSSNTPNSGVNRHRRHRSAANGSNASSSSGNSSPSRASRSSPSLSSSSSSSSSSASSTKSKTKTSSSFSSSSSFNSRRSAASLPVIVLLVSASHATNLGPQLDGSLLASYGQVVVVTLSYRLGALGFLPAHVDGILRGNYGLLDIVAGLHWLQQNIAAFGGQPANVTLIGHGHGAALAHILALSPMAKGLFNRVVLMSGSALAPWAIARDSPTYAKQVARQLSCPVESSASVGSSGYQPNSFTSTSSTSNSSPWPDFLIGLTRVECPAIFSPLEERTGLSTARRDRILRTLVRNSFDYHQQESDSVDGYSTALMITIVVGCSLLVLNVIVFLGFYCQVEGGNSGKSGQRRRSKATEEGDELSQLNATDQCEEGGKTDDPLLLQESVNLSSFDNSPHHHQQQQQPHHHHHSHPHHPHHQVQHNHPRQHNNLSTSRRGSTDTTLQSSNNQSHSHLLITSSSHNSASLSYAVVSGNEGSGNNDYRNGTQTPRAEHHHNHPQQQQQQQHQHQHRYSTLPGRRDRTKQCGQTVTVANIDTHHPSNNSGNINYVSSSTLTRIRQNPTEQWNRQQQQQQQFTINSNAASSQNIPCSEGAALYYVHYPPPPPLSQQQQQQHAEIVNAGEFEVAAFLDGMNTTAAAHCTPLKSILKHHQVQNGSGAQALLASPLYSTAAGSELGGTTTADPTSSLAIFEGTTVHYIPAGNSTVSVGNGASTGATTTATINGT
ncbi:PREDICTED: uncharacterized protein LOC108376414, partial [Rhagoletis zephyria]|uniref:uncharacterized protein LOC108376414 n=1 Tax=Rhagoletis zephyria TaxID=28612 RepID=UPI0008113A51